MSDNLLRILLVEDNPGDADLLRETLAQVEEQLEITHVESLRQAAEYLRQGGHVDVILLDLGLPDSMGIATLERTNSTAPDLPIIVLTGIEDEAIGIEAVHKGAQDYLVKGQARPRMLLRAIHHATERKRVEMELRRSKEDLNRAQAVAHVGSWRLDVRHNKLFWSAEIHRIFGVPEETPLSYETFLDRVHPDDRAHVDETWLAALHGEPYDVEHRIVVDGRVKWVREMATLEFGDEGTLLGGFGIAQDVTEQKRAEQSLRELNETLEQKVAERTAVAERRAQHLRQLTAELSQAEHRERKRLAAILHDDLQQLLLAARLRLAGVARGGDASLHTKVEAVDELLSECLSASRDLTMELSPPILHRGALGELFDWLGDWFGEKHGLTVTVDAQEKLPAVPEHIRVFFFHAVRELLFNTVKHSGALEARVSLSSQDGCLTIQVEDRGSGFDPKIVQQKLNRARSFGLFNIQERLEALEGRLEVGSTPHGGACFRMAVPLQGVTESPREQVQPAPIDALPPATKELPSKVGAIRLLVVDDHKVVREGLVGLLGREPGFEVVGQAADGRQAIRQAETLCPDVIVLDVEMPVMDGIEAVREIKQRRPDVLVIGLSLHEGESVARAMVEAGAAVHLSKHAPAEELVAAIRQACGRESPPTRSQELTV